MRIVLVTSETVHHAYFARRIAEAHGLCAIVVQTRAAEPEFEVAHPYEPQRDAFEREALLGGEAMSLADVAEVTAVRSVNDAVPRLRELAPDVILVFGAGRLMPSAIAVASTACLSLHEGDPERYRGLDSHLWAVYHRDFGSLVTTLNHVDPVLDVGDVVDRAPIPVARGMELYELRAASARVCVELTGATLAAIDRGKVVARRQQTAIGRFYSFMPAALKELCVDRFRRYTAWL